MMPVFAMEPVTLTVMVGVAVTLAVLGLVGLTVLWWAIKSTVRMVTKLIVFSTLAIITAIVVGVGVFALIAVG